MAGKWVELLKEIAPRVARIAMPFNPSTATYADYWLDPGNAWCNLLEQFHPFAGHRRLGRKDETGDVAARSREGRDEAAADRVGNERENDGDGARLLKQRRCGRCGARKKDIRL